MRIVHKAAANNNPQGRTFASPAGLPAQNRGRRSELCGAEQHGHQRVIPWGHIPEMRDRGQNSPPRAGNVRSTADGRSEQSLNLAASVPNLPISARVGRSRGAITRKRPSQIAPGEAATARRSRLPHARSASRPEPPAGGCARPPRSRVSAAPPVADLAGGRENSGTPPMAEPEPQGAERDPAGDSSANPPAGSSRVGPVRPRSPLPPAPESPDGRERLAIVRSPRGARRGVAQPGPHRPWSWLDGSSTQSVPRAVEDLAAASVRSPKRAQQAKAVRFAKRGHAGETMRPASPQHPHRQRFHLVRHMVAEQKVQNPGLSAGVARPGNA